MEKKSYEVINEGNGQLSLAVEEPMWYKQIIAILGLIDNNRKIVDFSIKDRQLNRILPNVIHYYSIVHRNTDIIADMNEYQFPDYDAEIAVCTDIIESLNNPAWFLGQLSLHYRKIVVSYKGKEKFKQSRFYSVDIIDELGKLGFIMTKRSNAYADNWTLIACFEKVEPSVLKENINCTGCGACYNICPSNAIKMCYDSNGFLKPFVDRDTCIKCNKCVGVCPAVTVKKNNNFTQPECYAVWADEKTRMISSSGGFFSIIAQDIIEKGGWVFGAKWSEDFYCEYVGINNLNDIEILRNSKYVQSNIKKSYSQIKALLEQNIQVAFFGLPCQVAGLKSYLGESYLNDKLLTIDLLCFYAPSNVLFRNYLDENYGIDNVSNIIFRDKKQGWSSTGYRVELKSGDVLFPSYEKDWYQQAFQNILGRNDTCENCRYADFPRQGDFTIGDFWGIDMHDSSWNDNMGTSIVLVNNIKAQTYWTQACRLFARYENVPLEWALNKGNRFYGEGRNRNKNYSYFLRLLQKKTFNESVKLALSGEHDIGIVCLFNHNIGNNLTNYALYQYLTDRGFTVLMIDKAADCNFCKYDDRLELFLENPYQRCDIAPVYKNKYAMVDLNDICGCFVLASDQLVRAHFIENMNFYSCLDWVKSNKYKIAYAASFGTEQFEGNKELCEKAKYFFKRFQKFSVREESGVSLAKDVFDIDTKWVLDPVFLCDKSLYENMARIGKLRLPKEHYVGAYILDPTQDRADLIKELAEKKCSGNALAVIDTDGYPNGDFQWSIETLKNVKNEEWLATIANSDFFITDSFHGVCFALIFQRQFCVVYNKWQWRGATRILSILKLLGLEHRMIENKNDLLSNDFFKEPINYNEINYILAAKREESSQWLEKSLAGVNGFKEEYTLYDIVLEQERLFHDKYDKIEEEIRQVQTDIKILYEWQTAQDERLNQMRDEFPILYDWEKAQDDRLNQMQHEIECMQKKYNILATQTKQMRNNDIEQMKKEINKLKGSSFFRLDYGCKKSINKFLNILKSIIK